MTPSATLPQAAVPGDFTDVVRALKAGRPAVVPTDTVCGVGVAVRFAADADALYRLKRRDRDKPISWLVPSADDLHRYGRAVPACADALAQALWPGALTLIVPAGPRVPAAFLPASGTIGLRMPDDPLLQELLRIVGPLACTSANASGRPAPARVEDVDAALVAHAAVLRPRAVPCRRGRGGPRVQTDVLFPAASTVVDCTTRTPRILREGAVSAAAVQAALA